MGPNIEIRLLKASVLLDPANHKILLKINNLINTAFGKNRWAARYPTLTFGKNRLQTHDQIVHELGSVGLLAIAIDHGMPQTTNANDVVACASLKRFKGSIVQQWLAKSPPNGTVNFRSSTSDDTSFVRGENEWEVTTCASQDDPKYRGVGLLSRCVDVLVQELLLSRTNSQPIKLYVTTLEGSGNTEYWERRGFVRQGASEYAPAGVWCSNEPFYVTTLSKIAG